MINVTFKHKHTYIFQFIHLKYYKLQATHKLQATQQMLARHYLLSFTIFESISIRVYWFVDNALITGFYFDGHVSRR